MFYGLCTTQSTGASLGGCDNNELSDDLKSYHAVPVVSNLNPPNVQTASHFLDLAFELVIETALGPTQTALCSRRSIMMERHQKEQRTVGFNLTINIYYVPSHRDMSNDEHRDTWLQEEDMNEIRAGVRRTEKAMRDRRNNRSDGDNDDNAEHEICDRGLEHRRSPAEYERRKINRDCCVSAVLDVQERQLELGYCSGDDLARASRRGSQWARDQATRAGMSDAAVANAIAEQRQTKKRASMRRYEPDTEHISYQDVLGRAIKHFRPAAAASSKERSDPGNPARSFATFSIENMLNNIRKDRGNETMTITAMGARMTSTKQRHC